MWRSGSSEQHCTLQYLACVFFTGVKQPRRAQTLREIFGDSVSLHLVSFSTGRSVGGRHTLCQRLARRVCSVTRCTTHAVRETRLCKVWTTHARRGAVHVDGLCATLPEIREHWSAACWGVAVERDERTMPPADVARSCRRRPRSVGRLRNAAVR
jgi:hypothetical protein